MRILYLLLILCLLAWPVTAASPDPGSGPAGEVRTHATTLPEIPAVPTTISPAEAWLTIVTDPEEATAIIDSAKTLRTPDRVVLAPGTHTVVILLDGYQDSVTKVNLRRGTWTDLRVTLRPAPDTMTIQPELTSSPAAGATRPTITRPDIRSSSPGATIIPHGSDTGETIPVTINPYPGANTATPGLTGYGDNLTNVTSGAGRQEGVIETVFRFFSSLFGRQS